MTTIRHPRSARCPGAQVAARRRSVIWADPVFDAGDHPPVRRGTTRRPRRSIRDSDRPLPATSPGAKPTSWPCGTAPASGRRTTGSPPSWPICAPRFGGPPTTDDLDVAATIATYAAFLGYWVENYEPIAWAEELIEPARAADHPRLAFLYVMASQCFMPGRIEAAVRYSDAGQIGDRQRAAMSCRSASKAVLGVAYLLHRPARTLRRVCAAPSSHAVATPMSITTGMPGSRLSFAGSRGGGKGRRERPDRGRRGHPQPVRARRTRCSPTVRAFCDADPVRALDALRRGLVIAQDSGNRYHESILATSLARLEAEHGDPLAAFDYFTLAIRNFHDSGNTTLIRSPLAVLAALFDRLGRYEPAATIAGFAVQSPPPQRPSPRSAPRSPTSAKSSATKPTNRSPARARR